MRTRLIGLEILLVLVALACKKPEPTLFTTIPASSSGIDFANQLQETPAFNFLNYLYFYNGGGVAIGDIDNDGLQDVYFSANQGANKLYRNLGGFRFEDITDAAGVACEGGWKTGVSMADVNGDGLIDIYACVLGDYEGVVGKNKLFINQGGNTFADEAARYGLDFQGFSTQTAWLDYDLDGDLDLFLLTHSVHANDTYKDTSLRRVMHPAAGDKLFRNDGNAFTDVTASAGIYSSALGYGLGVAVGDLDNNGYPDIYVCNDFHENDYLYLNQGTGSFRESLETSIGHTTRFSMGVDMADMNQDGILDIFTMDMKPEREDILKTSEGHDSYEVFEFKLRYGYNHQYTHNALQISQRKPDGTIGFSETAQLAGIDATDWSWSALWADYDLDGRKDLYITNGIYRRPNDMDYIKFISDPKQAASLKAGITEENLSYGEKMPQVKLSNYAYKNTGDLQFENANQAWGLSQALFSNGAAYVDLDNDGDLDLLVNNINEAASLYKNEAVEQGRGAYLKIQLIGEGKNRLGLGAKIMAYAGKQTWLLEQSPVRGFQSSVDPVLHLGLGKLEILDSLRIIWPGGASQLLKAVGTRKLLTLDQKDAGPSKPGPGKPLQPLFRESLRFPFVHKEDNFNDLNREALMPHQLSTQGPALALGDANGDGLEDVYIGGAKGQAGALFVQTGNGDLLLSRQTAFRMDSLHEDVDAAFFDADGDGDQDLYVVSGGNEFFGPYKPMMDRFYINEGKGIFTRSTGRLPDLYDNGAFVRPVDIDNDKDIDLFVGSRSVPGYYGLSPESRLLLNDGKGYFSEAAQEWFKPLGSDEAPNKLGMLTDAVWLDLNEDKRQDLILVGEWSPVRVFINKKGKLTEITHIAGLGQTQGWWNRIHAADMDGDGDQDFIAGNLGLNSTIKADLAHPCTLYLNDFDQNGSVDPVICYYKQGESYPMATRDELTGQLPYLRNAFPRYRDYAGVAVEDLFDRKILKASILRFAQEFASVYIENKGDQTFAVHPLPRAAQAFPIYGIESGDFDHNGTQDLLLAGNFYGVGPNRGRYDAGHGLLLSGDGKGNFSPLLPAQSGIWVDGEVRRISKIKLGEKHHYVFVRNNEQSVIVN